MLNFRKTSFGFIGFFCLIVLLHYFFGVGWWWLLPAVTIYLVFLVYGSVFIQSDFYIKAYCNSNPEKKEIAITFDDGPHAEITPEVLSVLSEFNIPATFFVIGKNIPGNEHLLEQADKAGHIIGNHTYSHSFFIDFKNKPAFMYELNSTSDYVHKIIHKRMRFFRPPYGVTTPHLAGAAKALKYDIIGWSVRSLDTKGDSAEKIMKRIKSRLKSGAIILFHDTSKKTIEVLKQTLLFAEENGFKIVSVEELLNRKAYE